MQLGHTSIQVQQWPVNAPLSASRAGIIKIPSVYTENSRKGRRGAIPSRGVHISRISGLHSPSKGTPDAGDDKVGPLFLAPASSLPTSQQAQGTKAAPSSSPPHGPPGEMPPAPAAAQVCCCLRSGAGNTRAWKSSLKRALGAALTGLGSQTQFQRKGESCRGTPSVPPPPWPKRGVLLPIFMTRPKTEVLSTVLQFHLRCRNWYWHSLMALRAPSPMNTMCSW